MKNGKLAKMFTGLLSLTMVMTAMPWISINAADSKAEYKDGDTISEANMVQGQTDKEYSISINRMLTADEAAIFDKDKIAVAITEGQVQVSYNASKSDITVSDLAEKITGTGNLTVSYPSVDGTATLVIYSDCGSVINTPETISVNTTNDATALLTFDFDERAGSGEGICPGGGTFKYYYNESEEKYCWAPEGDSSSVIDMSDYGVDNIQNAVVGDKIKVTTYWAGHYHYAEIESKAITSPEVNWDNCSFN